MKFSLHKADVFFYVLATFIVGVGVASVFYINDQIIWFGILAAAGIIGISSYRKTFGTSQKGIQRRTTGFLIGLLLLVFLLGVYRFNYVNQATGILDQLSDIQVGKDEKVGVKFEYVGYVSGQPEKVGSRQQFPFKVRKVEAGGKYIETEESLLVFTEPFPEYRYGDELKIVGAIERPKNYGDFDYITYLRRDGISFIASYPEITDGSESLELGNLELILIKTYRKIFDFKNSFENSINKSVAEPKWPARMFQHNVWDQNAL